MTGSGGGAVCTSAPLPDGGAQLNEEWQLVPASTAYAAFGVPPGVNPAAGRWWLVWCPGADVAIRWGSAAGPTLAVSPFALAQQAASTIHLAAPLIGMAPAPTRGVVNLLTYMWVNSNAWAPLSATASAGSVSATATATPDRVVWEMGNGDRVVCSGPGVPYDLSVPRDQQHTGCGYVYPRDSHSQPGGTYTVTVRGPGT